MMDPRDQDELGKSKSERELTIKPARCGLTRPHHNHNWTGNDGRGGHAHWYCDGNADAATPESVGRLGPVGTAYDSTADTLRHSLRVGELMGEVIAQLVERSTCHDHSKTVEPELSVFNEFTPRLRDTTYGSDEYRAHLAAMGRGLAHHYAANRHHPEHFPDGVAGMTLVDIVEMLCDWQAATERHADGDLTRSLVIQQERFEITDQLARILRNTARERGWIR